MTFRIMCAKNYEHRFKPFYISYRRNPEDTVFETHGVMVTVSRVAITRSSVPVLAILFSCKDLSNLFIYICLSASSASFYCLTSANSLWLER